jgi:hypothetical protein
MTSVRCAYAEASLVGYNLTAFYFQMVTTLKSLSTVGAEFYQNLMDQSGSLELDVSPAYLDYD